MHRLENENSSSGWPKKVFRLGESRGHESDMERPRPAPESYLPANSLVTSRVLTERRNTRSPEVPGKFSPIMMVAS